MYCSPLPGALSTRTEPPSAPVTRLYRMCAPSPLPPLPRRVVKNGEIQKIVDFLADGICGNNEDWKDRFKENSDRMRTGSLLEVAVVLKSLIALHQAKPLSFREKKMLERARYLLVSELAMARNCEESKVEEILTTALAKCKLRFPEASELQA